ncbi:glycoside hydrolase family 30 beta sandwich domain-containing protein [Paenibacillus thiaminolyticus]|uniref:Glucosylceramidase n=1 Tax=Paenibacillus thiaminolyticus TaxID=49283 RepID=A0A3A3GQ85_PANTH|nr:glycoside hydrolase family 30 protein [Paenibacillus thiaminolyticus]RJG25269.1 glucosylceramidase [Paenibacillus thiaminolyticus]
MNTKSVNVYMTARDTMDRLTKQQDLTFVPDADGRELELINVYEDVEYQKLQGFGGAFTEAAAVTLKKMSAKKQREIIDACFAPETGLGYTLCRTHIHSCDFALGNYVYIEEGDDSMESFDVERDRDALLPFMKQAMETSGGRITMFASPWSPPAWMKTSGTMNKGGSLLPQYRAVWAKYFVKYIQAYAAEGIDIWGVTVQNEPKAVQPWDSCIYTAEEERDFVRDYLGPALAAAGLGHVKIIVWDHNKERLYERARTILSDPKANEYVYGVGFHWYSGDHFEALDAVRRQYPDKALLFTEGCVEKGGKLGSWDPGERYAHDIIGNLNNGMNGWTDWNLLLDEIGGPNHVANYCDAPIIADTKQEIVYYQSSYYYIGQFSRFIRPGAVRLGCSRYTDKLDTTAFRNPDGTTAVVILNRTSGELPFHLRTEHGLASAHAPAHSIQTLLY